MFSWLTNIVFTETARKKAAQDAAKKKEAQRQHLGARSTQSASAQRQDDSTDLLNPLNPLSPLSPIHHQSYSAPAESSSHRECHSSHSLSYDSGSSHSSSHNHCSSSSHDSGSSSSYDSGSSSSSSYD